MKVSSFSLEIVRNMLINSIGIFIKADEIGEDRRDKYRRGEEKKIFRFWVIYVYTRRRNDGQQILNRNKKKKMN